MLCARETAMNETGFSVLEELFEMVIEMLPGGTRLIGGEGVITS